MGMFDRRERFARLATKIGRRAPGIVRVDYDPGQFAISLYRAGESRPIWVNLGNVWREMEDAPRDAQRERLAQLITFTTEPRTVEGWEDVHQRLRPVLRPQTFGQGGPQGMVPPLSRPALPYLNEYVVIDRPEAMEYVTPARLDEWGVGPAEVFAAARANLDVLAREMPTPSPGATVRVVDDGNGYLTSLLLAPGWLAELSERMGGPVLAFVPDRSSLLLCPLPDDPSPIYALVEAEFGEAPRALSPVGYRGIPDGPAAPYAVPPGHPHEAPVRRAEAVLAVSEYGAQTDWLAEEYEKAGMDVHVGRLQAFVAEAGVAETVATWPETGPALLPEARQIAFVRGDETVLRVPWRVVAEQVGLRPEPLLAPARYRVGGWPSPEVMRALQER